jgi:hypothetical protein
VDLSLPGIEVRPIRQMTGAADFAEVFLDDVLVPGDCLVGPVHGGWRIAMSTLTDERTHIGASVITLGTRLDELARGDGGEGAARDARSRLVARVGALQHLGRRQGPTASTAASLLKLGITEVGFDLAAARVDGAGPAGMLTGEASAAVLARRPGASPAGPPRCSGASSASCSSGSRGSTAPAAEPPRLRCDGSGRPQSETADRLRTGTSGAHGRRATSPHSRSSW